jgi:hypothetical protein
MYVRLTNHMLLNGAPCDVGPEQAAREELLAGERRLNQAAQLAVCSTRYADDSVSIGRSAERRLR